MESTIVEIEDDVRQVGLRLDRALARRLGISRARVRHLLEVGRITKAERALSISDKSLLTELGDLFTIAGSLRAEDERPTPRPDLGLKVAAEGMGWLVVDKPPGSGVHPLRPDQEDTVLNAVVARYEEILGVGEGGLRSGVVHRLDVDTSGVLLFAKDEMHWKRFRGAFSDHRVSKSYRALVAGKFEKARRVDLSLAVTRHHPAHVEVAADGRPCRQRVIPLEKFAEATLVEIQLETGFLHQIRATMAHLGHPVLGDLEYATAEQVAKVPAPRQMLHAMRLSVDEISAEAPLPDDMEVVLDTLRTSGS